MLKIFAWCVKVVCMALLRTISVIAPQLCLNLILIVLAHITVGITIEEYQQFIQDDQVSH